MPELNIGATTESDLTNTVTEYSVDSQSTDAATGDAEFDWQMTEWEQNLGFYKEIPELMIAVDTKALWTMGAGFEADEPTTMLLGSIKGTGKDSFNSIMSNMIRTYTIAGDAFSEVIRDNDGVLVNLKPLGPESIKIVYNKRGRITRYEQVSKGKVLHKYQPEEIFHLSRKKIADEVHGISVIPALAFIILAHKEAMTDWKIALHRNVKPMRIWYLDSDDTSKIEAFKIKTDSANENTENMYVPKGTVETEIISVAPNATLNPLAWIELLNDKFFQTVNVPQIITGNAKSFTDASGKIVYLAYEQSVKEEQLYNEEQVLGQLNLEINLTFPASMQNELISDENKEGELQAAEPNDTTAELEGPQ